MLNILQLENKLTFPSYGKYKNDRVYDSVKRWGVNDSEEYLRDEVFNPDSRIYYVRDSFINSDQKELFMADTILSRINPKRSKWKDCCYYNNPDVQYSLYDLVYADQRLYYGKDLEILNPRITFEEKITVLDSYIYDNYLFQLFNSIDLELLESLTVILSKYK